MKRPSIRTNHIYLALGVLFTLASGCLNEFGVHDISLSFFICSLAFFTAAIGSAIYHHS